MFRVSALLQILRPLTEYPYQGVHRLEVVVEEELGQ